MIEEDEFFVYLPSNSSLALFPENKLTSYKVQLARPIQLKGNYMVGLREIHYPLTWETPNITLSFPKDELYMSLNKISTGEPLADRHGFACVNANSRTYGNLDELLEIINQEIQTRRLGNNSEDPFFTTKKSNKLKLEYNKQIGRYIIYNDIDEQKDRYIRLIMSPSLAERFGFTPEQVSISNVEVQQSIISKTIIRPQWSTAFDYLYVYCDLIRYSMVGDVWAPLLRIIDVRGNPGESVSINYERPLYHPVKKSSFDSIEILIRDDRGEPIPFQHNKGRVMCLLHFMKVNANL